MLVARLEVVVGLGGRGEGAADVPAGMERGTHITILMNSNILQGQHNQTLL